MSSVKCTREVHSLDMCISDTKVHDNIENTNNIGSGQDIIRSVAW